MNDPKVRIFDIETNGLLAHSCPPGSGSPVATKIHMLHIHDYHANWYRRYGGPGQPSIEEGLKCLEDADVIVGHNIIAYDLPAIAALARPIAHKKVLDTLVLARLIHGDISEKDVAHVRRGVLPPKLHGSHKLEAWGYRLGELKDEYAGDPLIADEDERAARKWEYWNQAMDDYCEIDCRVTRRLFDHLIRDEWYFKDDMSTACAAVELEHDTMFLMAQMQRNGFPFGESQAASLYAELAGRRQEILAQVIETFGTWYRPKGGSEPFRHPKTGAPLPKYPMVKYPKVGELRTKNGQLAKTLYMKDAPYTPIEQVEFNPGSRDHIAYVLKKRGWQPTEFTETGKPKVDEETLADAAKFIPDEKARKDIVLIAEYLVLVKRIGQISEGDNGWLKMYNQGFIHGSVNPLGAVTGRASHSFPNIAQVPKSSSLYGPECRALFGVMHLQGTKWGARWKYGKQVGADASGLELRCLAHFMSRFDNGEYIDAVLNGDVHWKNVQALGLAEGPRDKHSAEHDGFRDNAKTFIYAFLYGAGDEKIGAIVGGGKERGKELKKNFMEKTPAILALRDGIKGSLAESSKWVAGSEQVKWRRQWIKGLDGRKVKVRSLHSALNTLLQSAGALICKLWIVNLEKRLVARGLKHGWDGDFAYMAWVHDEVQIACLNDEIAEIVKQESAAAMDDVTAYFEFRCKLETEAKVGMSWAECH